MRHKLKRRKLNRTSSHRKALLINLASALLTHELIKTTLPKAKELRPFVEKLMTVAKNDNLSNRRKLLSVLNNKDLVNKLFSDIAIRINGRNGGYTRIMQCGFRVGDKAPMAIVEIVDRKIEEVVQDKSVKASSDSKKTKSSAKPKEVKDQKKEENSNTVQKKVAPKKVAAKKELSNKDK